MTTTRPGGKHTWIRLLLTLLGGFEALMAATATPVVLAVGIAGGLALVAAAWLDPRSRLGRVGIGLVALGTVPFAAVAWTALVPLLLLAAAWSLAAVLISS